MKVLSEYAGFRGNDSLSNKLDKVLRNLSDKDLDNWVNQISLGKSKSDIDSLIEDLTNHETYFFRDYKQFDILGDVLLPSYFKKGESSGYKFRIWSAASASGEEAMTLAILALEFAVSIGLAKWNVKGELDVSPYFRLEIIGSDISRQAIRLAKDGIYTSFGLSSFRDMPERYWRYFKKCDTHESQRRSSSYEYFTPIDSVKKLVSFEQHNLMDKADVKFGKFDLIVCRNLLIYIDEPAQKVVQENLGNALCRRGALIFSAVDRKHDKKGFKEHWHGNTLYYEKV